MTRRIKCFLIMILMLVVGAGVYTLVGNQNEKKLVNVEKPHADNNKSLVERKEKEIVFIDSEYHYYQDLDEIFTGSDTIISGKILSYKDEILNIVMDEDDIDALEWATEEQKSELKKASLEPEYYPYRVFDVEIMESFKGNKQAGEILQVKQLFGEMDNAIYENPILLGEEENYVLFLSNYPNSPSSLVNDDQAGYVINDKAKSQDNLQPIRETSSALDLNLDDLRRISEQY